MARKQSKRIQLDGQPGSAASGGDGARAGGLTHNPFAALKVGAGREADREAYGEANPKDAQVSRAPEKSRPQRAPLIELLKGAALVVRHERKGHGGKTVTVIDLSRVESLSASEIESMAKDLRKALGAGARANDQEIVVQGDLVERVARFLETSYSARVTMGTRR